MMSARNQPEIISAHDRLSTSFYQYQEAQGELIYIGSIRTTPPPQKRKKRSRHHSISRSAFSILAAGKGVK
jgi:hypothetical protein